MQASKYMSFVLPQNRHFLFILMAKELLGMQNLSGEKLKTTLEMRTVLV